MQRMKDSRLGSKRTINSWLKLLKELLLTHTGAMKNAWQGMENEGRGVWKAVCECVCWCELKTGKMEIGKRSKQGTSFS